MLTFAPDFDRRIDLPGAGPCPRPVDIDRSKTGFARLVSLRVYSFAKAALIDGEAEGDEVFIVLLRGEADIGVDSADRRVGEFPLRAGAGLRAVYLPPHAAYRLSATTDCDIAYARVQPPGPDRRDATGFAATENGLSIAGYAAGMDLSLNTVPAGGTAASLASDGRATERFLHVRSDDGGWAAVNGERLGDWESAALADGEHATIAVAGGPVDILMISATGH